MTHRFEQLRLRLITDEEDVEVHASEQEIAPVASLQRAFPTVAIEQGSTPTGVVIEEYAWRGAFDLRSLDDKVEHAGTNVVITVRGNDVGRIGGEVLTRYQRLIQRRNEASTSALFDAVLRKHEELYAGSELAKNELDHAIDTWQWMLRLNPEVGLPLQLAALFHDIERLDGDTRERLEHRAPATQSTKEVRQTKGPERARRLLLDVGIDPKTAEHVRDILLGDTERVTDEEIALLNDADALSFLSLGSSAYVDYFGVAQTRRKVAYTLARLGARAKEMLGTVHFRPDVERLFHEVAA